MFRAQLVVDLRKRLSIVPTRVSSYSSYSVKLKVSIEAWGESLRSRVKKLSIGLWSAFFMIRIMFWSLTLLNQDGFYWFVNVYCNWKDYIHLELNSGKVTKLYAGIIWLAICALHCAQKIFPLHVTKQNDV